MAIDVEKYRKILEARQQELTGEVSASGTEAREADSSEEQGDALDDAVGGEAREAAFDREDRERTELQQVEDALRRVKAGTYGTCEICGREIEEARLNAVPWTSYCIDDARKLDPQKTAPPTL